MFFARAIIVLAYFAAFSGMLMAGDLIVRIPPISRAIDRILGRIERSRK